MYPILFISVVVVIVVLTVLVIVYNSPAVNNYEKHAWVNTPSDGNDLRETNGFLGVSSAVTPHNIPSIVYSKLGQNGRLGNQLFQLAATVGIGAKHDLIPTLPKWEYDNKLFNPELVPFDSSRFRIGDSSVPEKNPFAFCHPIKTGTVKPGTTVALTDYRQHVSYFQNVEFWIRDLFTPLYDVTVKVKALGDLSTSIGVHIRRGDYVGNDFHEVCTMEYYLAAIEFIRKQHPDSPVVFITDDPAFVKEHYNNVKNCTYSPFTSEIDDFTLLAACRHKVLSNSSFSWWAAYLSPANDAVVVIPSPWTNSTIYDASDIYLPSWHVMHAKTMRILRHPEGKPNVSVGAYYQCYKQPRSFVRALQSFRYFYPNSTIYVVNDNGDDLFGAASYFNVQHYKRSDTQTGNSTTTAVVGMGKAVIYIMNFLEGAANIEDEFFILMEDDVCVNGHIDVSEIGKNDILGCNDSVCMFPDKLWEYLKTEYGLQNRYYGGCGGSMFRTAFWSSLFYREGDVLASLVTIGKLTGDMYHSDVVLSALCVMLGGSFLPRRSHQMTNQLSLKNTIQPPILHQFKRHYKQKPTSNDLKILNHNLLNKP